MEGKVDTLKMPDQCYLHPHIEKRWINDEVGYGLFAKAPIKKDEVISRITGQIIYKSKIVNENPQKVSWLERYSIEIDDDTIIAPPYFQPPHDVFSMNHSCAPNIANKDAFTTIAMRNIAVDEQTTYDYATTDTGDIFERDEMKCFCGEPNCRKIIIGDDWMKPELWERYGIENFQPHIQRKIMSLKQLSK